MPKQVENKINLGVSLPNSGQAICSPATAMLASRPTGHSGMCVYSGMLFGCPDDVQQVTTVCKKNVRVATSCHLLWGPTSIFLHFNARIWNAHEARGQNGSLYSMTFMALGWVGLFRQKLACNLTTLQQRHPILLILYASRPLSFMRGSRRLRLLGHRRFEKCGCRVLCSRT